MKTKIKKGKYIEVGDFTIKAEKNLRVEGNKEVKLHDKVDTLPEKLKSKFPKEKKAKIK